MSERYQVNTSRGELGVKTNSRTEAEAIAKGWGTEVIDSEGASDE